MSRERKAVRVGAVAAMELAASRLLICLFALSLAISNRASAQDREYACGVDVSYISISCTQTGRSDIVFQYPMPELAVLKGAPILAAENVSRRQLENYRKALEKYRGDAVEGARQAIERFRQDADQLLKSQKIDIGLYRAQIDLYTDMTHKFYYTGVEAYHEAMLKYKETSRESFPTTDD